MLFYIISVYITQNVLFNSSLYLLIKRMSFFKKQVLLLQTVDFIRSIIVQFQLCMNKCVEKETVPLCTNLFLTPLIVLNAFFTCLFIQKLASFVLLISQISETQKETLLDPSPEVINFSSLSSEKQQETCSLLESYKFLTLALLYNTDVTSATSFYSAAGHAKVCCTPQM